MREMVICDGEINTFYSCPFCFPEYPISDSAFGGFITTFTKQEAIASGWTMRRKGRTLVWVCPKCSNELQEEKDKRSGGKYDCI